MRNKYIILLSVVLVSLFSACQKEQPVRDTSVPELTVFIGTDGFGDGCYNDNMLSGILGFCKEHPEVALHLQQPASIADAGKRLDAWISEENAANRALILASNSYESILKDKPAPKNGRVLILETDDVFPGHFSYIIRRYGASWLCGALSSSAYFPIIVKALDGNDMIDESEAGFRAGFSQVSDLELMSLTVADGPEGFAMRDSTYRLVYKAIDSLESYPAPPLIFPLLGGSIAGVFDYQRYLGFVAVAGMDVDCKPYATYAVPYSLMVNNNLVLEHYLQDWLDGKPWPEHQAYGLESEYVEVKLNPENFWPSESDPLDVYKQYYPLAVQKEKDYETE